jgi:hypothetical protein
VWKYNKQLLFLHVMKQVFVYILVSLMCLMVAHPCADAAGCAPDASQEAIVLTNTHNHCQQHSKDAPPCSSSDEEGSDGCTPLCVCACCQAPVLLSFNYLPYPPTAPVVVQDFFQPVESSFEFITRVWQPPRPC